MGYGTQKPPVGSQVNLGHPLANSLVGMWLFNEAAGLTACNAVGQDHARITDSLGWHPEGMECVAAATRSAQVTYSSRLNVLLGYTIEWRWLVRTLKNYNAGMSRSASTDAFDTYVQVSGAMTTNNTNNWSSFTAAGIWQTVAITEITGGSIVVYRNGIKFGSSAARTITDSSGDLFIGSRTGNATKSDAVFAYARMWKRPLNASEVAWAYAEPYGMIDRPTRKLYSVPTTGSSWYYNQLLRAA